MTRRTAAVCLAALGMVLAAPGGPGPARAGVSAGSTIADLQSDYGGGSYSNTDEDRQHVDFDMTRESVEGSNFTATLFTFVPGVEASGGEPNVISLAGSVSSKGKVAASGQYDDLKLKIKGTLSAGGAGIIGTYSYKRGKKTVDAGQCHLEEDK